MSFGNRKQRAGKQTDVEKAAETADKRPRFLIVGGTQADLPDTLSDPRFYGYDAKGFQYVNGHFFALMQTREKRK